SEIGHRFAVQSQRVEKGGEKPAFDKEEWVRLIVCGSPETVCFGSGETLHHSPEERAHSLPVCPFQYFIPDEVDELLFDGDPVEIILHPRSCEIPQGPPPVSGLLGSELGVKLE